MYLFIFHTPEMTLLVSWHFYFRKSFLITVSTYIRCSRQGSHKDTAFKDRPKLWFYCQECWCILHLKKKKKKKKEKKRKINNKIPWGVRYGKWPFWPIWKTSVDFIFGGLWTIRVPHRDMPFWRHYPTLCPALPGKAIKLYFKKKKKKESQAC